MNGDGPPTTFAGWRTALHKAAAVPPNDPDYAEAQQVKALAVARIGDLMRQGTIRDAPKEPGPLAAIATGIAQGPGLGLGEFFSSDPAKYRAGVEAVQESHPWIEAGTEMAGDVALAGTSGVRGGAVPVAENVLKGTARRIATGAGTGAAIGGTAGLGAGGQDPTDMNERIRAAARDAIMGSVLGAGSSAVGTMAGSKAIDKTLDRQLRQERVHAEGGRARWYTARAAQAEQQLAKAAPGEATGGATAQELAVAKRLGVPVEQVRGRVGDEAVLAHQRANDVPRPRPPMPERSATPATPAAEPQDFAPRPLPPDAIHIELADMSSEVSPLRDIFPLGPRERPPFSTPPPGGVTKVSYPGRQPFEVPLNPDYAESMGAEAQRFGVEHGLPGSLPTVRGTLEIPLPEGAALPTAPRGSAPPPVPRGSTSEPAAVMPRVNLPKASVVDFAIRTKNTTELVKMPPSVLRERVAAIWPTLKPAQLHVVERILARRAGELATP